MKALDITPFLDLSIAPRAVFDALEVRGEQTRFRTRCADGWDTVTWNAFAGMIRAAASWLVETGFEPGDRAAIYAPNSVEWAAAALAIQAAGGVMVPIYASCTAEQAGYVIQHSDARVVFADGRPLLDRLAQVQDALAEVVAKASLGGTEEPGMVSWATVQTIGARADEARPGAFEARMDAVDLDDYGLMLYTSGTSGQPKGVPLTHRNVAVNGRDWLERNAPLMHEGASDLLWLPMSHIFGLGEMCLGNTLGFTTTLSDPLRVLSDLPAVRPTVFMSVPSVWEKLAEQSRTTSGGLDAVTGGRLRFCLSGGAGLERAVKEHFERHGILLLEGYGLTEASPTLTLNAPGAYRFDSVGQPLPSVELRLADDGEILARGPSIFGGYHKDPDATREAFTADGWLKTGDIGRFTSDGFLQIVDRKKDILVTSGGKNIPPQNIELRFTSEALIEHIVVYGDGRKYLVAGVWPSALATANLDPGEVLAAVQSAIDRVNAGLARHETIKRFGLMEPALSVESGLLTPTFKVKRKRVYEVFKSQLDALYEAPRAAR